MQKSRKITETLGYGYSHESTLWGLFNEYQQDRFRFFLNLCVLVFWTNVTLALEGLTQRQCTRYHPFHSAIHVWWHWRRSIQILKARPVVDCPYSFLSFKETPQTLLILTRTSKVGQHRRTTFTIKHKTIMDTAANTFLYLLILASLGKSDET